MKKYYNRLMATMLATLFASTVFAGDAEQAASRYLYNATRGAWPVSTTSEEQATPRYIETHPLLDDLKTLQEMKDAIASGSKKYMAVLFMGWDWCEVSSRLLVEWRKGIGDDFVTTIYDWPETDYVITEGNDIGVNVSLRSRENAYAGTLHPMSGSSSRAHVWPAIALYDGDGKMFAFERGVEYMTQAELQTLVADRATNYEAYLTKKNAINDVTDDTFAAAAADGDMGMRVDDVVKDEGGRTITLDIYKAALLAEALIELEKNVYSLPLLNSAIARQADYNQIAAWDPHDVSGAMRRIKNNDLYSTAEKFRVELTDERKAALADLVDNTRLVKYSDNEYQQALLCGFNLYKQNGDMTTAEVYARRAIDVNPSSFWGEGARGQLLLDGVGPVTLGHGWKNHHLSIPSAKDATDDTGKFDSDAIAKQDGISVTNKYSTRDFTWTIRYGNDLYLFYQGWYNITMQANSVSPMMITSFKIYMDTATLDDPTKGTLIFDGSQGIANQYAPTNGDDMASFGFTAEGFNKAILGATTFGFNFYMPRDVKKVFPLHEKDWTGQPRYNDIAIVIQGTLSGTESTGTFSVNPIQTATAQTAPKATQITIDDALMDISSVLDAQRDIVDAKMSEASVDGESVADAVEALLTGETPDIDFIKALTRGALFYEYESEKGYVGKISEVASQDKDGVDMLNALVKDQAWITDLLTSGPGLSPRRNAKGEIVYDDVDTKSPVIDTNGNLLYSGGKNGGRRGVYANAIHRLALLWRLDKIYTATKGETRRGSIIANENDDGYDPLIRRMATVGALNAAPYENGMLGQTHWFYRDALEKGLLHGDFLTQSAAQMRYSLNALSCHVTELSHALKTGSTRIDSIDGTAWQTSYLGTNFFGAGINNDFQYFGSWNRTVLPSIAMGREIGAVCGGISKYGVLAANATGRRSITGGQPGHCAAAHRSFDGTFWEIDSNVSPETGSHFSYWEDYTYQSLEYYDDMWDDPRTLVGYQLMWAARLRALSYGEKDPGVEALYHRAVTYAPLCYQAFLEYRDYLKANYPNDADRWLVWAEAVTYGLWRYPKVGWGLLNENLFEPLKAQYGELGALAAFKQLHVRMHDTNRKTREAYNYVKYVVTPQTKLFNETNMISLVATALDARYVTPRFNDLINWGNTYYTIGTHDYTVYQTMLQSVYEANGNSLGVMATCLQALRAASKDTNLVSFKEMSDLYVNLFHSNEEYPILSTEPALYEYSMVSADGALTLSSYPELNLSGSLEELHNSAQSFCHAKSVINNAAFDTYSVWTQIQTDDPWVMVQLPGDAEIFGVVVQNAEGTVSLTVEISSDAQQWTPLVSARSVEAGGILNVAYNGSTVSRYVRVRYPNLDGREVRLKLNKVQVFAKKRY